MVKTAKTSQPDFGRFVGDELLGKLESEIAEGVSETVRSILSDVSQNGDAALLFYTNKFDGTSYGSVAQMKVSSQEIEEAFNLVEKDVIDALKTAAARIESYHKKQMPADIDYVDESGVRLGNIWRSVERVGLYVPGGLASYPSSVLMNAIPAKVAGVDQMVMVVPAPRGELNPVVLAAAKIAGVTEIYKTGGAQAIAALAVGTENIRPVSKIVGPGNAYVAEAKRQVSGIVGIDMIAGPSEILVIADDKNNPDWIAADLLSQAEHDANAQSIVVAQTEEFAKAVEQSVERFLQTLPRSNIARASWENNGRIIIADNNFEQDAINLINVIAPEHLELAVDDDMAERITAKVKNAGAIFLGRYTPEAIGDYIAGPSHVLPTSGTARFSSGLSVYDFLKRVSLIGCNRESFKKLAKQTELLANKEGLDAHALSVSIRNEK